MTEKTNSQSSATGEIDLIELVRTFREGRGMLVKAMIVFAGIGLLAALLSSTEYTATTTVVPQSTEDPSRLGGLSGLASMAGINLNMGTTSEITPALYSQIIFSVPFQIELMQTELTFSEIGRPVSLLDYFIQYKKPGPLVRYTLGLPGVILRAVKEKPAEEPSGPLTDGPIRLTEDQRKVQKVLKNLISVDYNEKDGYVALTCRMPEALPAAQLAQQTQKLLQQYITEFKVEKSMTNLNFVRQRYEEVQKQYNQSQEELARFRDRNKNVSTAMAQTELERLSNNYNLAFTIYTELAKQLEQAKMQVKEDTPVLTVIEPVSVPLEKSKPKRLLILIIWTFLGFIAGAVVIFGRKYRHIINRTSIQ